MNTNKPNCISDADLSRWLDNDLDSPQKQALQEHLDNCPECQGRWEKASAGAAYIESLFGQRQDAPDDEPTIDEIVKETEYWWSQFVGSQILQLFARVPEEIEQLLKITGTTSANPDRKAQIITLSILEPSQQETLRLAAATGDGFAEQTLTQDDPPFQFHLAQFGRQLRVDIQAVGEDPTYQDCLARLELSEGETCLNHRIVLVQKGQAQLVLAPDEIAALRPQHKPLAVKLTPLVSLDQLAAAGAEAYLPILTQLLAHRNPQIRVATIAMVGRLYGPQAPNYVKHLADDPDESVRQAVNKVISQVALPPGTLE